MFTPIRRPRESSSGPPLFPVTVATGDCAHMRLDFQPSPTPNPFFSHSHSFLYSRMETKPQGSVTRSLGSVPKKQWVPSHDHLPLPLLSPTHPPFHPRPPSLSHCRDTRQHQG